MVIKMNFEYSEKDENFRKEVKDWLDETLPRSLSEKVKKYQRLTKEDYEIFMNNLTAKGWLAWHWPKDMVEQVGTQLKNIFLKKK